MINKKIYLTFFPPVHDTIQATTLTQYDKVNDIDDYDDNNDGDDVHSVGDNGDGFPGGNYAINGPGGVLYGKSDTGFIDEELLLKCDIKTYIKLQIRGFFCLKQGLWLYRQKLSTHIAMFFCFSFFLVPDQDVNKINKNQLFT